MIGLPVCEEVLTHLRKLRPEPRPALRLALKGRANGQGAIRG